MRLLAIILVISLGGVTAAQEQSLGDIARQNRAAKKRGTATRVITNDQIPSKAPEQTPAPNRAQAPADPVVATAPSYKKLTRSEVKSKVDELKTIESEQEIIITKFEAELRDPNLPGTTRTTYESALAAARARHASLAKEREVMERALNSVEQPEQPAPKSQDEAQGEGTEQQAQPAVEGGANPPTR